ncbi:hypothetical protein, partial [Wolbachia endosymbiont of Drosophila bicornuta]
MLFFCKRLTKYLSSSLRTSILLIQDNTKSEFFVAKIPFKKISNFVLSSVIALFTIIRTDHNMLLLYHSHKHISYPIRT